MAIIEEKLAEAQIQPPPPPGGLSDMGRHPINTRHTGTPPSPQWLTEACSWPRSQVRWNGDHGRTYFFQAEMPYDVRQEDYGDHGHSAASMPRPNPT